MIKYKSCEYCTKKRRNNITDPKTSKINYGCSGWKLPYVCSQFKGEFNLQIHDDGKQIQSKTEEYEWKNKVN